MTVDAAVLATRARSQTAVRTAVGAARGRVLRAEVTIAAGYWALMVLGVVVVPLIVRAVAGSATFGLMVGVAYSAPWVVFSLTIALVAPLLRMHLGAGGTRRSLHQGVTQALVLTGVVYGAAFGLVLTAERAYVEALGLEWSPPGGLGIFAGGIGVTALGEVFVLVVYALVGATLTALFQAGEGPVRTVGASVLTVLFLPAVELVTRSGTTGDAAATWLFEQLRLDGTTAVLVGLALAAGLTAALATWYWRRLRTLQLRPPS